MSLLKLIKNSFIELLESNSGPTYTYKAVNENRGKMTPDEILEKVTPIITEENLHLNKKNSIVKPYRPTLQENAETGHLTWLVTILFERLNGRLIDESERKEYFWVIVDDQTGEVSEKIYPR
jgi:hypothetical protein